MGGAEVGNADPTHLAFLPQSGHFGPAFFYINIRIGPMDLPKVQPFHIQPPQTVLAFLPYRIRLKAVGDNPVFTPDQGILGENIRLVAKPLNGLAHHLFRMAPAIGRSGINPIDPFFDCPMDGLDGILVVLGAPVIVSVRAADGPGTDAQRRDV